MADNAAIYVRTGGYRHAEATEAQQADQIDQHIREQGYELGLVYRDADPGRSAWHRMMRDAEEGDFDVIVAYHPDRMFSSLQELSLLLTLVDADYVRVEFCRSAIDLDETTGRLAARIMATAYEAEDEYQRTRQEAEAKMSDAHWRRRRQKGGR